MHIFFFCLLEGLFISHSNYSVLQNLSLEKMYVFCVGEEAKYSNQAYGLLCFEKCLILLVSLGAQQQGRFFSPHR